MDKKDKLNDQLTLTDALLRLKSLESLLIRKGIFTQAEYSAEMESVTRAIAKSFLKDAGVAGDLDSIINELVNSTKGN